MQKAARCGQNPGLIRTKLKPQGRDMYTEACDKWRHVWTIVHCAKCVAGLQAPKTRLHTPSSTPNRTQRPAKERLLLTAQDSSHRGKTCIRSCVARGGAAGRVHAARYAFLSAESTAMIIVETQSKRVHHQKKGACAAHRRSPRARCATTVPYMQSTGRGTRAWAGRART